MIIKCEACGKTHEISPDELKDDQSVISCKACYHPIIVRNPTDGGTSEADPFDVLADPSQSSTEDDTSADPFAILEDVSSSVSPEQPSAGGDSLTEPPAGGASRDSVHSEPHTGKMALPTSDRQQEGRSGLGFRLSFVVVLVSLVPLILFALFAPRVLSGPNRAADTTPGLERATIASATRVDAWMDHNFQALTTISRMPDIISMKWRKKEPMLAAVMMMYPWIRQIVTLDHERKNVGDKGNALLVDFTNLAAIKAVIGGKDTAWGTVVDDASGKSALVMAVPVKLPDGSIGGVIAGLMDIDDLTRRIADQTPAIGGVTFLVDRREGGGGIIPTNAPDQKHMMVRNHPLIDAFHKGQTGLVTFTDEKGTPSVGKVVKAASGWGVAAQMQTPEPDPAQGGGSGIGYWLLLGAAVVLVFLMAVLSSRVFTKPIRELVSTANRISLGELDLNADTKRKDEIGDLAEAFTRMQDSVRISIERLRRQRAVS